MKRVLSVLICLIVIAGHATAICGSTSKLQRQIGQMVIMGFNGIKPEDSGVQRIAKEISQGRLGGVILYQRNIVSPEQLSKLTTFLQNQTIGQDPLFIAVDQEGGKVARLKKINGFVDYPSHEKVANDQPLYMEAFITYKEMANELRLQGINFNFAPVVDLKINKDSTIIAKKERSFSDDPQTVYEYARVFIEAHRDVGVLTAIKHWPGHGSARGDTHLGMVDVTDTWNPFERFPYERLIAERMVDSIMSAHVFHRKFDVNVPATMSKALLQEMLRENIGYEGVIITDCLQMGAITALVGNKTEDAAFEALLAGADIMLLSNFDINDDGFVERLARKVEERAKTEGGLINARVRESNRRIAKLKKQLGGGGPGEDGIKREERDEL